MPTNKLNRKNVQADPVFKDFLKDLKIKTQVIENELISERELTRRIGMSERVKAMVLDDSKLRAIKRIMGKTGQIQNSVFMIFILIGILLLGAILFFVYSLLAPPVVASANTLSTALQEVSSQDAEIGGTINDTAIPILSATKNLEWFGYGVLVSFLFGYFIILFYVRSYPFLIYIWMGLVLILVFLSIFLASSYNDISGQDIGGGLTYQSWALNDYILGNLPIIISGIGVFGGVVLFVLVSRDQESGVEL